MAVTMRLKLLISIALIVTTFAVYWQVGSHEFLIYDDDLYVSRNPHVAAGLSAASVSWALTSVEQCNWHPLTWLSHMLDVQLFGMDPRGHHLMNVAYHGIATLLLFFLLSGFTGAVWRSGFVAAMFALHPLRVESVAWAAERKDVLSACFWFLTLFLYGKYAVVRQSRSPHHRLLYLLTVASFVLGLMAKPMLVTLPFIMLLMDYWPLRRFVAGPDGRNPIAILLKEKLPFLVCMLLSSAATFYAQRTGGAVVALDWIPFGLRLKNALVSYISYITKTVWPHDLAVLYPFSNEIPLWQVIAAAVALILLSAASLRSVRRYPFLAVGWLWYCVTLLPVIGLVQVGNQSMADRYSYIPSVGLFILVAWGVPSLFGGSRKGALALIAGLVVCASAVATWHQIGYWRNNISLFRHALDVTTGNHIIHYNLGIAYGRSGDHIAAIREFHSAVQLKPNDSKLRNLLAVTLAENGYIDAALEEFSRLLLLNPADPEAANALEYWRRQKDQNSARLNQ